MEATAPGPDLELQQLLPEHRTVSVGELLSAIDPAQHEGGDRPHTLVNFVATVDGRTSFHGRSGPIGDEGDRQMFHGLRERVDAVMAGTVTMRTERYGRIARDPERRRRRSERGLAPEPLAVIVTRSGDVPFEIPLFAEPEARVVIFTPTDLDTSSCSAQVEVVRLDPGHLTLTTVWRRLTSDFGVRLLLCEGGPTVFGALLHEDLADELFLTLSPRLAGGGSEASITHGPPLSELLHLTLRWALEREGSLFLRYGTR
ncbi:MAG TPA: dihydrofolate reductase family protein [Solirubrobacteraceae bacterium]|jgi:5-amino-6-(5-phosphoribosylamino)uracil reductase|nr:dihydrofolate reductase family protein [Solirubrobacteraceae bacterium]